MFDLDEKYRKYRLELYSLNGQKILSLDKNNEVNNTVNVDFLSEGTYVVNIYFGDKKVAKKLVIKK